MRVLFLAMDAFGSLGGIAQYNRDLLGALCAAPEVSEVVAVPRRMASAPETLPAKLTYISAGLAGRAAYIKAVLKLSRQAAGFDLVVCGHIKLLPVAYVAKLISRAPLVLVIYGIDAWTPIKSCLMKYSLSKIDFLVSISDITRQKFLAWSHLTTKKSFILPCAVNQHNFGVGHKPLELIRRYHLNDKTVLMTMGRLEAQEKYKGFDEVMEVLPHLIEHIPNLVYLIVGEGNDRPRLEAKADSLGVRDRVVFAGFIPEAEKSDHYRLADAFVLAGRGEGFGIVFLEALAAGIPVVGSILDGSREALRNGALGILVDPRRADNLQAGILGALRQPRGVVPAGLDYFSFENFVKRSHDILAQAVKFRGRS
jgi:phosphatidylinositol alpha-1,6-mannosyltransferase